MEDMINFFESKNCKINECSKVSFDGDEEVIFIDVSCPYKEYNEKLEILNELGTNFDMSKTTINITKGK